MSHVEVTDVTKRLGNTEVLRGVTVGVPSGGRLALVGASGSGKTTLLRLIAGFERVDSGRIAVGDEEISSERVHRAAHRRGIGYVAQDGALFPHRTVRRNIGFGLRRGGDRRGRVEDAAALAGLEPHLLDRYPHQLSGGQQQRVALARTLAPGPQVVLLDEPFSALDTALRASTREAVTDVLDAAGVTTVLVTHDHAEALAFGTVVGIVDAGRVVQAGSAQEVYEAPATPQIARALGDVVEIDGERCGDDVVTAFGRLPVRSDRSTGGVRVTVLLRPGQVRLATAGAGLAGVVEHVDYRGEWLDLSVRAEDGRLVRFATTATHDAPTVRSRVAVEATGEVMLFDPGP